MCLSHSSAEYLRIHSLPLPGTLPKHMCASAYCWPPWSAPALPFIYTWDVHPQRASLGLLPKCLALCFTRKCSANLKFDPPYLAPFGSMASPTANILGPSAPDAQVPVSLLHGARERAENPGSSRPGLSSPPATGDPSDLGPVSSSLRAQTPLQKSGSSSAPGGQCEG